MNVGFWMMKSVVILSTCVCFYKLTIVTMLYYCKITSAKQLTDDSCYVQDVSRTVLFAIGIGGYNMNELQAVATQPICSHIYTLDSFSFINSILLEIKKSACEGKYDNS